VVKLAQGDAAEAIRLLTEAVKLKARSPGAANDLGRALHGAGDHVAPWASTSGRSRSGRLIRRRSTASAMRNAALGRLEEALQSYQRALIYAPHYAEALNGRGAVLLDLGRAEEALESCTERSPPIPTLPRRISIAAMSFARWAGINGRWRALTRCSSAAPAMSARSPTRAPSSACSTATRRRWWRPRRRSRSIPTTSTRWSTAAFATQHLGRLEEAVAGL